MNLNELNDFCSRWLIKADSYDTNELSGAFDSFWSTFVAYNALYNEVEQLLIARGEVSPRGSGDKRSATVDVPVYLCHEDMARSLKNNPDLIRNIQEFTQMIKDGTFYIHSDKSGRPNYAEDRKCIKHIEAGSDKEFCEALMVLIYKTRCNMFHGNKEFHPIQARLLNPMTKVLRAVITQVRNLLIEI
jgi:hypothetical protein